MSGPSPACVTCKKKNRCYGLASPAEKKKCLVQCPECSIPYEGNPMPDPELFQSSDDTTPYDFNMKYPLFGLIYTLIGIFALFLSFRCNGNKFDLGGFLAACLCPFIYIPYKLGTSKDFCGL